MKFGTLAFFCMAQTITTVNLKKNFDPLKRDSKEEKGKKEKGGKGKSKKWKNTRNESQKPPGKRR